MASSCLVFQKLKFLEMTKEKVILQSELKKREHFDFILTFQLCSHQSDARWNRKESK